MNPVAVSHFASQSNTTTVQESYDALRELAFRRRFAGSFRAAEENTSFSREVTALSAAAC
jgi:hypothetical protein